MDIAIIEDEQVHSDLLVSYISEWGREKETAVSVQQYKNAKSFLFQWEDIHPDILFLDIRMPGMNGMELARKVREKNQDIVIVFTTGMTDYIQEGYEVEAMHYLLKPLEREKVEACLERAFVKRAAEEYILVHTDEQQIRKLPVKEINFIEAQSHKSVIKIAFGESLTVREGLSEIERMLEGKGFIKCHRSYICRLGNIHHIEKERVIFDDRSAAPVSRRMYQEVNQEFIKYFRKV